MFGFVCPRTSGALPSVGGLQGAVQLRVGNMQKSTFCRAFYFLFRASTHLPLLRYM